MAYTSKFTSGVIELRVIPDDYTATVHNDYIYYHAGDNDLSLNMNMMFDTWFGPEIAGNDMPDRYFFDGFLLAILCQSNQSTFLFQFAKWFDFFDSEES